MVALPLPEKFKDLERFTEKWVLSNGKDRHHVRLGSRFEELKALYDSLLPRMDMILEHLDQYPIDEPLPVEEHNLKSLALSFMEVACPVELFRRAEVRGFPPGRMKIYL